MDDVVSRSSRYEADSVEADDASRRLHIYWRDGRRSAYPYIWLRHGLFHPATGRPEQGPDDPCLISEDPKVPTAGSVRRKERRIEIEWSHDGSTTSHDLVWLRNNCISEEGRAERRRLPKHWSKREAETFPWFEFEQLNEPELRLQLFLHIRDYGVALVRGVAVRAQGIREVAKWFGPINVTHFGEIFDIRSKPEDQSGVGANIGGTQANAQAPHSDEGYRHTPIGINFFHCLKPDPGGRGASVFLDGIAAAERLRLKNPAAFEFLASVPVIFAAERNPTERFRARGLAVALDQDGVVRGVRVSDRTFPPLDLPEHLIEPAYEALAALKAEVYDYSHAMERVLQAGECIIFDNHRLLHTRRSFDKQSGERWLQQASVNREEYQNQMRVLAEAQGRTEEARVEPDAGMLARSLRHHHEGP